MELGYWAEKCFNRIDGFKMRSLITQIARTGVSGLLKTPIRRNISLSKICQLIR